MLVKDLARNMVRKESRNINCIIPRLVEYRILHYSMVTPSWYAPIPEIKWILRSHSGWIGRKREIKCICNKHK